MASLPSARVRYLLPAGCAGFGLSLLSALPAGAHGLAGGSFTGGVAHPLLGLDHLLVLVGVGAVASFDAGVLSFALAGAVLGALFGAFGGTLPAAEILAALAVSAVAVPVLLSSRPGRGTLPQVAGPLVGAALAIHALLHARESAGGLTWWLGAAFASAAVVLASSLLLRRVGPDWTRRLAVLLLVAGGGLALVPFG